MYLLTYFSVSVQTSKALLNNELVNFVNCYLNRIKFLLFSHLADAFIQSDLQIRKSNYNYKLNSINTIYTHI